MDHVPTNVAIVAEPSNLAPCPPLCTSCGKPSRPWRTKRPQPECRPPQLELSYSAKTLRILLQLILHSRLPQADFATSVLGVDQATLYRYLHGKPIPRSKAVMIRSIEYIERQGSTVHLVVRSTPETTRWRSMEHVRRRDYAHLMTDEHCLLRNESD